MITFDLEEDWDESAPYGLYYDSYDYIDSGILTDLAEGLLLRGITATFYVTPNVARNRLDDVQYIEKNGHKIGLHLHVHNLLSNVSYPYSVGMEDSITYYDFGSKVKIINIAKNQLESSLGHELVLFRSGRLHCDYQTEVAALKAGFKGISNHVGIFPVFPGLPFRLWNLGAARIDLFSSQCALLDSNAKVSRASHYNEKLFGAARISESILVFSAHPMLLYDKKKGRRNNLLDGFFEFLDFLINKQVGFIEQHQLLSYLKQGSCTRTQGHDLDLQRAQPDELSSDSERLRDSTRNSAKALGDVTQTRMRASRKSGGY